MIKVCPQCKKEFRVKASHCWRVNCSMDCYNKAKKGRFIPNAGQFKKGKRVSIKTEFVKGQAAWNKGKTGCVNSGGFKVGHPQFNTGRTYWTSDIVKNCDFQKKRVDHLRRGSKHQNWNGGSSFEPYGMEFNKALREQVRKRDGFRCQECFRHQNELFKGTRSGIGRYKLHVHHIDYDKNNNSMSNLISLCMSCHLQTNYSRKDWVRYFAQKNEG